MRAIGFATLLCLVLGGPVLAEELIVTAPAAGPAAPQPTTPAPPLPPPSAGPAMHQAIAMGPCGPEKIRPDGRLETAPHGAVEVGVGTHGYREAAGAICQPLGQNGAVAISVDAAQGDWGRRR